MMFRIAGIVFILLALAVNPYTVGVAEPGKKAFVMVCEAILFFLGLSFFLLRGTAKRQLALTMGTLWIVAVAAEAALRLYLFMSASDFLKLRSPQLYGMNRGQDDFWYYIYRWSDSLLFKRKEAQTTMPSGGGFYSHWVASLEFDPELGYKRKANVTYPGHETSNLATRGKRQYDLRGPKILFYGDSYVESDALSDRTLTAKIEAKTGIDCLNYGVGGYGLDQVYVLFARTVKQFDPARTRVFIGITDDELLRMLLTIRQSAKPYFVINDGNLVLHTEHIDVVNPRDIFERYKPRFRIFLLELLLHEIRPLNRHLTAWQEKHQDSKIRALAGALLDKFQEAKANITFVVFSDWKGAVLKSELARRQIPTIAVDEYLRERMGNPHASPFELYPGGHPSEDMNDAIADHILTRTTGLRDIQHD